MFGLFAFAAVIGLIWLEIVVFGLIGHKIGVLLTIIGVFVTAAIGLRLFRISGRATMKRMAESVAQGRAPLLDVADGAAIMMAAFFLLIPGYATDALGIVLFIPGLRTMLVIGLFGIFKIVMPKMPNFKYAGFTQSRSAPPHSDDHGTTSNLNNPSPDTNASDVTIEGDYKRED